MTDLSSSARARLLRGLSVLVVLAHSSVAGAAPLPPAGPPPDPSRGDRFDGRAPPAESAGRRLALAFPRILLAPPRVLLRAVRRPVLALVTIGDSFRGQVINLDDVRPRRAGAGPVFLLASDLIALGGRAWHLDLFGHGRALSILQLRTGGTGFADAFASIQSNPAFPVGGGVTASAMLREREPFYGLAGQVPHDATADELQQELTVVALDGRANLTLRPRGVRGRWRARLWGGGSYRWFGVEGGGMLEPIPAVGVLRGGVALERLSLFDASRHRHGFDASLAVEQSIGVLPGDEQRYLTATAQAGWTIMVGGRRSLLLRGLAGDQQSWGDDPVVFYDTLSRGGTSWHRGYATRRFRGGSVAAVALDYGWPIIDWLDGLAFIEYGDVMPAHFEDFEPAAMRTSIGAGVKLFGNGRFLLRLLVGYGVGDGPRAVLSFEPGP